MEFIELNRTFYLLPENLKENDDLENDAVSRYTGSLHWDDLLREYRIIILSEAGSGKTEETRNTAQKLREQGKDAFFIRLEYICSDFETSFDVGDYKDFQDWENSIREGWIFLDSVDEARLSSPKDFERAIRKLNSRISKFKDRIHITITGRTTEWRPETDLKICEKLLPFAGRGTIVSPVQNDSNPEGAVKTEKRLDSSNESNFKIFCLNTLSPEQIKTFITSEGISDSNNFLNAVERADAWSFTSRPEDLKELLKFWLDHGHIGSRLDIIENSIQRRLKERDEDRNKSRPLPPEMAHSGVKLLAAATTLSRNQAIGIPDGTKNRKGIPVADILRGWTSEQQSTLLSRPIFDEAIYGAVRFHHRSVREYLVAKWFFELLTRRASRPAIENLFFKNQHGIDIITPTLRPILPWVAIWDQRIRERLLKEAPEIFLENGAPSHLPLETRKHLLHDFLKRAAEDITGSLLPDYTAIQRFANRDLAEDIQSLLNKYVQNEDISVFLMRMVSVGQIKEALPQVKDIALNPCVKSYTRKAAFKTIKEIGSPEDSENIRRSCLEEESEIKRELLAELIIGLPSTKENFLWLLNALERCAPKHRHKFDYLESGLVSFIENIDINLLPILSNGCSKLLRKKPFIERRFCRLSENFQWLLEAACKAIGRLIEEGHSAALTEDSLTTLHQLSVADHCGIHIDYQLKDEIQEKIIAWPELNHALFWHEAEETRQAFSEKSERPLTYWWNVSLSGSLWQFDLNDFEYFTEEISRQNLLDNKLIALSLAWDIFQKSGKPQKMLVQIQEKVSDNNDFPELYERLQSYLSPPKANREQHQWQREEAKRKKRREESLKEKEENKEEWKKFLSENLEEMRSALHENPGKVTNHLLYLYEETRNTKNSAGRWTERDKWKTLIPEYGENVARFYRDETVYFWRHYQPQIPSEGAPINTTPYAVIIGLTGLETEANETDNWPKKLTKSEVELTCRYASFELNGFPTWFSKIFDAYPEIVSRFLLQEISYDLKLKDNNAGSSYIINDVTHSGEWAWGKIASGIFNLLKKEPENLSKLDNLLRIIQQSDTTVPDDLLEKLASRKSRILKSLEHTARWFAVWTGVAPETAIPALENKINNITEPQKQTEFAMIFVTHLMGGRLGNISFVRSAFKKPEYLKSIYLLMHKYIRLEEDTDRVGTGVYTPELRDEAQDSRDSLLTLLKQSTGKEAFIALNEIAQIHPSDHHRQWIARYAKEKAEQDGDIQPWEPQQVWEFNEHLQRTPRNHKELAELAVLQLRDLKDDLENGDGSVAGILQNIENEPVMRNFIGRDLREKACGRYSIPQEEELADSKKPDLRFHGNGFDEPVPIELKLAENWSGNDFFERLENQLCGDYLRDKRSGRGIFLLVYQGRKNQKNWRIPKAGKVSFSGLIEALQNHWKDISPKFSNIDEITVIGIDLTKRGR